MRIYLLRHGTAEPRTADQSEEDDFRRELVDKGREQCRRVAAFLRGLGVEPEVVMSSPLTRAYQTAEEVRRRMKLRGPIVQESLLSPGSRIADAVAAVIGAGEGPILAVGHEPLLSQMVALLVGGRGLRLDLRKGGLVEIEILSSHPPQGTLLGLLRPGHLSGAGDSDRSR